MVTYLAANFAHAFAPLMLTAITAFVTEAVNPGMLALCGRCNYFLKTAHGTGVTVELRIALKCTYGTVSVIPFVLAHVSAVDTNSVIPGVLALRGH